MNLVTPRIRVIICTLIFLTILESILVYSVTSEVWARLISIVLPIATLSLFGLMIAVLKKMRTQSVRKEKQYQQLLDLSPEAIYVHRNGVVLYSNEAGAKLFETTHPSDLIHRPWREILNTKSYESLKASSNRYETDQQFKIHHFELYGEDGSMRYLEAKSTFIEFDGQPAREVIARDITVQENKQQMLKAFSYLDPLTQLPNRRSLLDQLDQMIYLSNLNQTGFGMMFIDLDGFKQINDTYGHDQGDALLKQVSEDLKLFIREGDVVGRFGGDEFIILLPDVQQVTCLDIANKIIAKMPISITGQDAAQVTLSVGVSLYPEHGKDSDTLIKNADEAMYRAKKLGKNNFQLC